MISEISNEIKYINLPNMPVFKIRASPYTWEEVKYIIKTNALEKFARLEEGSNKYLKFKKLVIAENLTIFKYLLINQLKWAKFEDIKDLKDEEIKITGEGDNFKHPDDIKIVLNDFPYNFEHDVVHLCVWTKFRIPVDENSIVGDISSRTKKIIEKYLHKTFDKYIEWDNLVWFKNWESLQSVKSLSHVHVILKGLKQEHLDELLYSPGAPLTDEEVAEII